MGSWWPQTNAKGGSKPERRTNCIELTEKAPKPSTPTRPPSNSKRRCALRPTYETALGNLAAATISPNPPSHPLGPTGRPTPSETLLGWLSQMLSELHSTPKPSPPSTCPCSLLCKRYPATGEGLVSPLIGTRTVIAEPYNALLGRLLGVDLSARRSGAFEGLTLV